MMKTSYLANNNNDYSTETNCTSNITPKISSSSSLTNGNECDNKLQIVWSTVVALICLHIAAAYGLYLGFTTAKIQTIIFGVLLGNLGGIGITAGAHRLWSHRAYKAKWHFRLFLALLQTIAFQFSIYNWARDHRVHHRYAETNADPHNIKRVFFFAHMGWLMVKKHKEVSEKGATIDMSDLEADPIVMFQKKYYYFIMPFVSFIIPALIPVVLWNENLTESWYFAAMFRYVLSLHITFLGNSVLHLYGDKPYDTCTGATDNIFVAILTVGEGWHNYHHVFPWDYKAAELGNYRINVTTFFLDLAAKFGLVYDLKTVSKDIIYSRVLRTGDGTHPSQKSINLEEFHHLKPVWGWNDKDNMTEKHKKITVITHNKKSK